MGLYDKKSVPKNYFLFDGNGKPSIILLAVVAALVLLILGGLITSLLTPRPLSFTFDKNRITSSEQAILTVGVGNPFNQTARNVTVRVYAEDESSISISEPVKTIEVLDKYRELTFLVNPVGSPLPGNYQLNLSVTINEQTFSETTTITIEAEKN